LKVTAKAVFAVSHSFSARWVEPLLLGH
jgi:hypothetical protein